MVKLWLSRSGSRAGASKESSEVISRCEGDQPGVSCLLSTDILQIEFRTSVTTEYFRN